VEAKLVIVEPGELERTQVRLQLVQVAVKSQDLADNLQPYLPQPASIVRQKSTQQLRKLLLAG
jgi:hypothetical protein